MTRHETPMTGLRNGVSTVPKGLDFIRVAIAKAVATEKQIDPADYAARRWGQTSRAARLVQKATLPAINTQTGAGTEMISDEGASAEFFDLVRAQSIVGKLPLRRMPFYTATLNLDEGPAVGWRDEGGALRTSTIKATRGTGLEPLSVGAITVLTNEMLQDRSVASEMLVRDALVKALATEMDSAFISPSNSGSAGVKPASVTNGNAVMDSPSESLFDWGDTFAGDVASAYLIVNPWQAARLSGAARPNLGKNGGNWAGFPALTSMAVPEGIVVLLDPEQIGVAMGGAEIDTSNQADIDMVDSSSMTSATSVAGASMVSLFQAGSTAVRGMLTVNWRVVKNEAVQVFDLQAYGLAGGL